MILITFTSVESSISAPDFKVSEITVCEIKSVYLNLSLCVTLQLHLFGIFIKEINFLKKSLTCKL